MIVNSHLTLIHGTPHNRRDIGMLEGGAADQCMRKTVRRPILSTMSPMQTQMSVHIHASSFKTPDVHAYVFVIGMRSTTIRN